MHSNDFLDESIVLNEGSAALALVVLNGATEFDAGELLFLVRRWKGFKVTICADGGANRLHDAFSLVQGAEIGSCRPDYTH